MFSMSCRHDAELILNNGLKFSDGYYERHFKEGDGFCDLTTGCT